MTTIESLMAQLIAELAKKNGVEIPEALQGKPAAVPERVAQSVPTSAKTAHRGSFFGSCYAALDVMPTVEPEYKLERYGDGTSEVLQNVRKYPVIGVFEALEKGYQVKVSRFHAGPSPEPLYLQVRGAADMVVLNGELDVVGSFDLPALRSTVATGMVPDNGYDGKLLPVTGKWTIAEVDGRRLASPNFHGGLSITLEGEPTVTFPVYEAPNIVDRLAREKANFLAALDRRHDMTAQQRGRTPLRHNIRAAHLIQGVGGWFHVVDADNPERFVQLADDAGIEKAAARIARRAE